MRSVHRAIHPAALMGLCFVVALAARPATAQETRATSGPAAPQTQPGAAATQPMVEGMKPDVAPEKAIVLELRRPFVPDDNASDTYTLARCYGSDVIEGSFPRLSVGSPKEFHAFHLFFPLLSPDARKYPIVVTTYRASRMPPDKIWYGTWMSDETNAINGGFHPLKKEEIISDGKVHEVRKDLRKADHVPEGVSRTMLLQVSCDEIGPSEFDLIDMRFEAAPDAPVAEIKADAPLELKVTGEGQPIKGAKVILDYEWRNFARAGATNAEGAVTITPLANESHQHTARVEAPGWRMRQVVYVQPMPQPPAQPAPAHQVDLVRGACYGGTIVDPAGHPVHGAMVTASFTEPAQGNQPAITNEPVMLMTDRHGHWRTPMLPAEPANVQLTLSYHTDWAGSVQNQTIQAADALRAASPAELEQKLGADENKTDEAVGADVVTLHKAEGGSLRGRLMGLSDGKLSVAPPNGAGTRQTVPLQDLVDLTREVDVARPVNKPGVTIINAASRESAVAAAKGTATPAVVAHPPIRVTLEGDDQVAGVLSGWSQKSVALKLNRGSMELEAPLERVRELWIGTSEQEKKARALKNESATEDVAYVQKDEGIVAVRGIAIGTEGDSLSFRYNDADRKIALNRLIGVVFGGHQDAPPDDALHQVVHLDSGDTLSGTWKTLDKGTIGLQTRWGAMVNLPFSSVKSLDIRNGRLVYLSDRKPTRVEEVPFFDRVLGYRMNKSLAGSALRLTDGEYTRGIAVHSRCLLHYDLGGRYEEFKTKVGFQQPDGKAGQAAVRVLGDGKVLFEAPDAKGDAKPAEIDVKVSGVNRLTLEVDYGKGEDVADRVVWAEPRLLRQASATP